MLNPELELGHLTQIFEVFGHSNAAFTIFGRQKQVLEDLVGQATVVLFEVVAGCLMQILSGPESPIGNIDIQS